MSLSRFDEYSFYLSLRTLYPDRWHSIQILDLYHQSFQWITKCLFAQIVAIGLQPRCSIISVHITLLADVQIINILASSVVSSIDIVQQSFSQVSDKLSDNSPLFTELIFNLRKHWRDMLHHICICCLRLEHSFTVLLLPVLQTSMNPNSTINLNSLRNVCWKHPTLKYYVLYNKHTLTLLFDSSSVP